MPAVKSIPIRNEEGQTVAQRFEASNEFQAHTARNYVPMQRGDGKAVRVNRKLAERGNYHDKGFTEQAPARAKEKA